MKHIFRPPMVIVLLFFSGCTAVMSDAKVVDYDDDDDDDDTNTPATVTGRGGGEDPERTPDKDGGEDIPDTGDEVPLLCTPSTVEDVCDTMFSLCEPLTTLEECYAHWVGDPDPEYNTVCADETGYFGCVCQCLDVEDCETFALCELGCWADNC